MNTQRPYVPPAQWQLRMPVFPVRSNWHPKPWQKAITAGTSDTHTEESDQS